MSRASGETNPLAAEVPPGKQLPARRPCQYRFAQRGPHVRQGGYGTALLPAYLAVTQGQGLLDSHRAEGIT